MLTRQNIYAFLKYFLGACTGLGADWLTWFIIIKTTSNPYLSQGIGRAVGACVAFYLFKHHVFQDADTDRKQSIKFATVAGISWLISLGLTTLGLMFLVPIMAKIASDGITFLMNWFIMRFWVFKRQTPLI